MFIKTFQKQAGVTETAELTNDILKTFMSQMNDEKYSHWERLDELEITDTFIAKVLGVHRHQNRECVFVKGVLDDPARKIYYETCVRFVYQYFHEFEDDEEIPQYIFEEQKDLSADDIRGITCDHKLRVLKAVMAFCENFGKGWPAVDNQVADYFQLALMLKRKHLAEFQVCFEKFLRKSSHELGEYYEVALKQEVRLLFIIATRRKFYKTRNFIFQKFPHINVKSTVMKDIYDTQVFTFVIIDDFESESLSSIVNSLKGEVSASENGRNDTSVNIPTTDSSAAPLIVPETNFQKIQKLLEAYDKESLNDGFWRKCEFPDIFTLWSFECY